SGSESLAGPKINWLTPTPPLPSDCASEDANAPGILVDRPEPLTPVSEMCRSSEVCSGSAVVPNNGAESWKMVPPGIVDSMILAEMSTGTRMVPAYRLALEDMEIRATMRPVSALQFVIFITCTPEYRDRRRAAPDSSLVICGENVSSFL